MAKTKTQWVCGSCGGVSPRWAGQCPQCEAWNTLSEQVVSDKPAAGNRHGTWAGAASRQVVKLKAVKGTETPRKPTGIGEFDRVLGGGLVDASVLLLGGDPGIGKSTLLLQSMAAMSAAGSKVLYVAGEESPEQIALRAERMGLAETDIEVLPEVRLESILDAVANVAPNIMVVDSIQTLYTEELQSAPGSVAQVRDCAARLTRTAKERGVTVILVGHVTKEGSLAGPRVLEHMVDTVLYFEGDASNSFRMIRAIKNRFGPVNELGVFAMGTAGLEEVSNPSSLFLTAHEAPVAGTCVAAAMEGNRPFLVEVQALVEDSATANPKRFASGVDTNRVQMLLAVLNKHAGVLALDQNVYLKVVGGLRLTEPGIDLALLLAIHSSIGGRALPQGMVALGEVGLAGEIRPVRDVNGRLKEAQKLGFTSAVVPAAHRGKVTVTGIRIEYASRVSDVLSQIRKLKEAA